MKNEETIRQFYEAFAKADAIGMTNLYAPNVTFTDPAFGTLKGEDAKKMWRMLIDRSKGNIKITFSNIVANDKTGSAQWQAEYNFAQTGRPVINKVSALFEFENGKIIKHTDSFDVWKWSQQAFGFKGYVLGWSGFMRSKIQQQTKKLLNDYTK